MDALELPMSPESAPGAPVDPLELPWSPKSPHGAPPRSPQSQGDPWTPQSPRGPPRVPNPRETHGPLQSPCPRVPHGDPKVPNPRETHGPLQSPQPQVAPQTSQSPKSEGTPWTPQSPRTMDPCPHRALAMAGSSGEGRGLGQWGQLAPWGAPGVTGGLQPSVAALACMAPPASVPPGCSLEPPGCPPPLPPPQPH